MTSSSGALLYVPFLLYVIWTASEGEFQEISTSKNLITNIPYFQYLHCNACSAINASTIRNTAWTGRVWTAPWWQAWRTLRTTCAWRSSPCTEVSQLLSAELFIYLIHSLFCYHSLLKHFFQTVRRRGFRQDVTSSLVSIKTLAATRPPRSWTRSLHAFATTATTATVSAAWSPPQQ